MTRLVARKSYVLALLVAASILISDFVAAVARPASRSNPTAAIGGDFCAPRLAHDYLAPLKRMTPLHLVPPSGRLPFGPRGMRLEAEGGRLLVGGGQIGFGLRDEAIGQIRHLNWTVVSRLVRVDSSGRQLGDPETRRRRIGAIGGNRIKDFVFPVPAAPAYYRVDISIADSDRDKVLGSFGSYVRVVRPSFHAELLARGSAARQGESIAVRIANVGTETISSLSGDWRFAVQRYDGQGWVTAPSSPPAEKRRPIIRKLSAGQLSDCIEFRVPSNEEPGQYRFSVVIHRTLRGVEKRDIPLRAEFEVSGRKLK